MPQMMPLNWLTLFMFFTMIFFIYNSMNYFSFLYTIKTFKSKKHNISFNWKW
uniref:ATP synthase complex subunit 8 n=1 Tax=Hymaea magna TaxID=1605657 RepID=A0A7G7MU60_9CUCU|nr:ATP synthase F0 subunit 8 [Hymaea magna]QNG56369.1 ATP synthase F0 subunit 8 [Hymaea magna]